MTPAELWCLLALALPLPELGTPAARLQLPGQFPALVGQQLQPAAVPNWLLATATHLPSIYTNQESGYFSIIQGHNGKLYIGTAKYGENAYLLEFDPATRQVRLVMDVHEVISVIAFGFAAQAKIHTRNNVGASGVIYVGSKQGYPEKGEPRTRYPGGYVLTHDPKTGRNDHFGIAKEHHGIISVMPDESRGVAYVSTCSDDRPIDHSHFMILDLKKRTYRDLGDMEHAYAFIVLDAQGRAYHPKRGGSVARYDPATDRVEFLPLTVNGQTPPALAKDGAIQNWDASPDGKTLWCVELTTNALYAFDLTGADKQLPGRLVGELLPSEAAKPGAGRARRTDCRAMCVASDGKVWVALTEQGLKGGPLLYLVGYDPAQQRWLVRRPVGIANPDYITLTDAQGKPKPWHHTIRKEPDGTLTPWQPMGIAAGRDGSVFITTIAPFTVLHLRPEQLRQ